MPRDKFHVGQRVIWSVPGSEEHRATVRSQRVRLPHQDSRKISLVYPLDVDGKGTHVEGRTIYAAPEPELRPLYDGDQVVGWSTCAWRPKEVSHA